MKVKVDGPLCTGHGRCYMLAPSVYESDDEGYNRACGTVIDVAVEHEDEARLGAEACPECAITVLE